MQYRVLVDVLLDAKEHPLTGVGRDELLASVRERIAAATDQATAGRLTSPEVFDLDARMKALQGWDVVIRWQDKAKFGDDVGEALLAACVRVSDRIAYKLSGMALAGAEDDGGVHLVGDHDEVHATAPGRSFPSS